LTNCWPDISGHDHRKEGKLRNITAACGCN
jgi:hypothetical protein